MIWCSCPRGAQAMLTCMSVSASMVLSRLTVWIKINTLFFRLTWIHSALRFPVEWIGSSAVGYIWGVADVLCMYIEYTEAKNSGRPEGNRKKMNFDTMTSQTFSVQPISDVISYFNAGNLWAGLKSAWQLIEFFCIYSFYRWNGVTYNLKNLVRPITSVVILWKI